jgi:hypothetical protein
MKLRAVERTDATYTFPERLNCFGVADGEDVFQVFVGAGNDMGGENLSAIHSLNVVNPSRDRSLHF